MAQPQRKFAGSFKVLEDFKIPSYDFNAFLSIGQRNVEALNAANQVVAEGIQAIAKRQSEIVKSGAKGVIGLFREVYSSETPEAGAAKQAEFVRSAFENAMANVREVVEMVSKSNIDATEVLTTRLTEVIGEVSKVSANKGKKSNND